MLGREALITVEKALELLFHYAPFKRPCEINLAIENAYGMVVSRSDFSKYRYQEPLQPSKNPWPQKLIETPA